MLGRFLSRFLREDHAKSATTDWREKIPAQANVRLTPSAQKAYLKSDKWKLHAIFFILDKGNCYIKPKGVLV